MIKIQFKVIYTSAGRGRFAIIQRPGICHTAVELRWARPRSDFNRRRVLDGIEAVQSYQQ